MHYLQKGSLLDIITAVLPLIQFKLKKHSFDGHFKSFLFAILMDPWVHADLLKTLPTEPSPVISGILVIP